MGDKACELLEELGVNSAVVNFGGNIITIGGKKDEDFKIGIQKPFSDSGETLGYMEVKDATVVTSGIYERGFTRGKYYHHILDVETGWPAETDISQRDFGRREGNFSGLRRYVYYLPLLGVKDGMKFIDGVPGVEAVFVDRDGKITKTEGMTGFVEAE